MMSTSTINVAVNGNPAFTREGDEATVKRILEAITNAAHSQGYTPQQLADNCLFYLGRDGGKLLSTGDASQGFQMMAILWRIFQAETNNTARRSTLKWATTLTT
jgi:hypothetical protein